MNYLEKIILNENQRIKDYRVDLSFNDIKSLFIYLLVSPLNENIKIQFMITVKLEESPTFITTISCRYYGKDFFQSLIIDLNEWLERYKESDFTILSFNLHLISIKDKNKKYISDISNCKNIYTYLENQKILDNNDLIDKDYQSILQEMNNLPNDEKIRNLRKLVKNTIYEMDNIRESIKKRELYKSDNVNPHSDNKYIQNNYTLLYISVFILISIFIIYKIKNNL